MTFLKKRKILLAVSSTILPGLFLLPSQASAQFRVDAYGHITILGSNIYGASGPATYGVPVTVTNSVTDVQVNAPAAEVNAVADTGVNAVADTEVTAVAGAEVNTGAVIEVNAVANTEVNAAAVTEVNPVASPAATVVVAAVPATKPARFTVGGSNGDYPTLQALFAAENLQPGDIVDVNGGFYPGNLVMREDDSGAPGNPVILRGVGATRPHLSGGTNTVEFRLSNHVVMEHFEISGTEAPVNTFRCVFHHANDITLRDVYIHDCPNHGVQSADEDSGSLTIEYSEIANAGSGGTRHAIYVATDEVAYPGSVFRLQYSYVHDSDYTNGAGGGGHLIKSRAERNEIYYNWLEGAYYHELELIGPDPYGARAGWTSNLAREDSDIVGNVIVHTNPGFDAIMRFGGDGTGQSYGRYRFVNNTVVGTATGTTPTVFRLFHGIESLEAHNNVFWQQGSNGMRIIREVEAAWTTGATRITGSNNWIDSASTSVPGGLANTILGTDPGFANAAAADFRPATGSALIGGARLPLLTPPGYEIAASRSPAPRLAPYRAQTLPGVAFPPQFGTLPDIGAYQPEDSE